VGHLVEAGGDAPLAAGAAARSVLDGVDPRARIVAAGLFAVSVVAVSSLPALAGALAIALALMAIARLPPRRTLKRMAAVDGFVLFLLATLPFTVPGEPVLSVLGLPASREGFRRAIEIALTANAVVLSLMALVGGMEPVRLGHALHALKVPDRLVHLMLFTVRYVSVIEDESRRLRTAMRARGFLPRTDRHTFRTFGYLVGMMLVRALERSERILEAMKCRGFDGRIPVGGTFRLTRRDAVFAAALALAVCALAGLEVATWSR